MVLPVWAFWVALAVMFIGLLGVVLPGVPGVGLIWIAALVYAIAERFTVIDPLTFVALTILAALGVTSDIWVSQAGGKVAGASWQAMLASLGLGLLGALIGLLFGGVGALPGGVIGALLGVTLVEYYHRRDWKEAAQAGGGWIVGCLVSGVVQLVISLLMIGLFVWQFIWQAMRG
jgi:uncharacterized protein YqgC (DUF456 family)